jgi:hypothetical protein
MPGEWRQHGRCAAVAPSAARAASAVEPREWLPRDLRILGAGEFARLVAPLGCGVVEIEVGVVHGVIKVMGLARRQTCWPCFASGMEARQGGDAFGSVHDRSSAARRRCCPPRKHGACSTRSTCAPMRGTRSRADRPGASGPQRPLCRCHWLLQKSTRTAT